MNDRIGWFSPAALSIMMFATAGLGNYVTRSNPEHLALPLSRIDDTIQGWSKTADRELPDYTLRALNPTSYLVRDYRKGKDSLNLFTAFYAQQRSGESMHSPKHCLPGSGWEIWKLDSARIPIDGESVTINKYSIQNAGNRLLMFYWYQSKDRIVADEYRAKFLLARDTLLTGQTAGSIVRFTLPDSEWAVSEGEAFARSLIPLMRRCFRGDSPAAALQGAASALERPAP